ncbi:MAG: dihydroorotate dehydrogenase electron transfer subunit [Acidobacteria bacterium]|nr:dihydroorotate dehydrogenase electron transfer subunit [Acidobacteriota bacterium]
MNDNQYLIKAKVIENLPLSPGYHRLAFYAPEIAEVSSPGQFLLIRGWSGYDPFLPRPMSINELHYEKGKPSGVRILFRVVGRGTKLFSLLSPGDEVSLRGPLGNGFPLLGEGKAMLVAGGIGVSPLLFLANKLKGAGVDAELLIGGKGREDLLLLSSFENLGVKVEITTEDGTQGRKGVVTELLEERLSQGERGTIYACGPEGMLKEVARLSLRYGCEAYLSLERRMACGIGACLGCAIPIKREGKREMVRVCKEGPVFPAGEVIFDE